MPEHTIAENLARLQAARTAIGEAITAKGGTVDSGDGFEEFPADIAAIPSGGGGNPNDDVRFLDYDGTIVQSYSAADFANLTDMPSNPSHEGLTAQGWNWELADAKTYVAANDKLDIGQMYNTNDDASRLYIHLEEGRLSPVLGLGVNGTVDVDWGDGTAHGTLTGTSTSTPVTIPHTYARGGDYVITLTAAEGTTMAVLGSSSGSLLFTKNGTADNNSKVYLAALKKTYIGDNVTSIGGNAFNGCYGLTSVTIPDNVTSIEGNAFYNCYSLTSITIPDNVTSIGGNAFSNCYSLTSITIPDGVTSIGGNAFNGCYSLTSITIPDSVTSIGSSAFNGCYSLTSVTIHDSVTSIGGNAFYNCYSLTSITIPDSITSIGVSAFSNCYSLTSVTIPDGVTSIGGNAFSNCYSLTSVTIPDSVTSIGSSAFNGCYSLTSVTIPDSVTSIRGNAFQNCYGLGFIKFSSTTPPTIGASNTFGGIPTDCVIYVPEGTLEDYTSATNYPDDSVYTYVEY